MSQQQRKLGGNRLEGRYDSVGIDSFIGKETLAFVRKRASWKTEYDKNRGQWFIGGENGRA